MDIRFSIAAVEFCEGILSVNGLSKTSGCSQERFGFLYWSIISMQF